MSDGVYTAAVGADAMAIGFGEAAYGGLAMADGEDAVAIGFTAAATGASTTAVGGESVATGPGATSFGWQSSATAERAHAIGHLANASGVRSLAVGEAANAAGDGSVAIGNQASASGANSIAISNGATAANDGQVVIASLDTSTASQIGRVGVVTADANGTLGIVAGPDFSGFAQQSALDMTNANVAANTANIATNSSNIASLQQLTSQQSAQINQLFGETNDLRNGLDRANEGVAMALAMESPMLPAGTSLGHSGGVGYFGNQGAGTIAATVRAGENAAVSAGLGVGFDSGEVGARAGFQIAW